jgi:hypothetical protein
LLRGAAATDRTLFLTLLAGAAAVRLGLLPLRLAASALFRRRSLLRIDPVRIDPAAAFRSLPPLRAFAPLRALPLRLHRSAGVFGLHRLLLAATLLLALLRRLLPALLRLRLLRLLPLLVRAATLRLGRLLLAATLLLAL